MIDLGVKNQIKQQQKRFKLKRENLSSLTRLKQINVNVKELERKTKIILTHYRANQE